MFLQVGETKNSTFMAKLFVKHVLLKNMPDPPYSTQDWNLFYAEFNFFVFNDIFLANYHLKRAEFKNTSYIDRYRIYVLKKKINKHIRPELVGLEKDNFIEKVVELEHDLFEIKVDLGNILDKSRKFWTQFEYFDQVALSTFKSELEDIVNTKVNVLQHWSNL